MNHTAPPRLVSALLERLVGGGAAGEEIAGDLHEEFISIAERHGPLAARWWYVAQVVRVAIRRSLTSSGHRQRRHHLHEPPHPHGDSFMRSVSNDVRHAFAAMIKRPGVSALVIITLALGLGANATIFEAIDALVLRPFTLRDLDRIVMVAETTADSGPNAKETVAPANYLDWRKEAKSFERIAAFDYWNVNLAGTDEPERILGYFVSDGFFSILGVPPALGRPFTTEEETRGRHRVAILSDGLWRRRFGADPGIIGRPVLFDAEPYEIVGIMPAGFAFPSGVEVWAPLAFDAETAASRRDRYLSVVARLAPGRTVEDAKAEMAVIASRLEQQYPDVNRGHGARVMSLAAGMLDQGMKPILSLWQASAGFVLLIACANIANLLLARGAERQREMAVRIALGAGRFRIVRQLLVESLVLAAAAVPAAIGVAWIGVTLIRVNLPARLVRFVDGWSHLDVDLRLIGFTALLAAATAAIFGIIPSLQASRPQLGETLKDGGRSATSGPRRQWLRRLLVVAEIALALPLLVASGLAAIGTQRFLHGSQGYDGDGVLSMRAVLPDAKYAQPENRRRFVEDVTANLMGLPGAQSVAAANAIPAGNNNASRRIEIEGQVIADTANPPVVDYRAVTASFFETLRIPLRRGRGFDSRDKPDAQPVAIVSESMAARHFPGADPIGKRIRFGTGPWVTIVGISGDVIHDWFDRRNYPTVYRPYGQAPTANLALLLRATGDLSALQRPAAAAVTRVDAAQPLYDMMTMKRLLHERTIGLQYISAIMAVFGGLALVLAIVGVYSLMAFFVTQRKHEIGVRIALGATRRDVLRLAVGQAARLTAVGVALGLALAFGLGRLMEAGLLGVVSSDARVALTFAAVLIASALVAGYVPARRATVIDPIVALRSQ